YLFFLLLRPPPTSTLFPYTTLFRSASTTFTPARAMLKIYNSLGRTKQEFVPLRPGEVRMYVCGMTVYDWLHLGHARMLVASRTRSEEHTSELQSRENLVCRLLLEKK